MQPSASVKQQTGQQGRFTRFLKGHGSVVVFLLLFLLASLFIERFFTVRNMLTIVKQAAVPVVACMGMMLILTTGGIDLSLGYTLGLCSIFLGILSIKMGVPAWQAVLLTLVLGALVGLLNGCIIHFLRVPAFIATLGVGYVLFGIAQIFGKGDAYYPLPDELLVVGTSRPLSGLYSILPQSLQDIDLLNQLSRLPSYVFISLAVLLGVYVLRHRTIYGRQLSAFGFNRATARLSGVNTARLHVSTYVISSTLVALAAILLTIRVNTAQSNLGGANYTFEIVTAAVVGGTSLFGGVSSVVNCLFGCLITKTLENVVNLLAVSIYLYQPMMGLIILLAIIFEAYKNRKL